ncbi:hypothetical protein T01_12676 [Trichinella spiralis]|uniref:Uncharacterized protein n=1 Tax=Trichinella spiralis TaxID=6334 RepID=A0A0V1AKD8_TRISP|nr:hypothetical protein T01_12676 [Trichinella spiralis]
MDSTKQKSCCSFFISRGRGYCILCDISFGAPFVDKLKLLAPFSKFFRQIIDFPSSCMEEKVDIPMDNV